MSKRGQLYIFAALILAVVLFLLISKSIIVYQEPVEDDFEELSRNYNYEASKFINSLLGNLPEDEAESSEYIKKQFVEFTADFTSYSKNQNPDFMLIYAFKQGGTLFLGNYLNIPILIRHSGSVYETVVGCFEEINSCINLDFIKKCTEGSTMSAISDCTITPSSAYPIDIFVNGVRYSFEVGSDSPEVVIMSRENLGEQRKVYMDDDFVIGERFGDTVVDFSNTFSSRMGLNFESVIGGINNCWILHGFDKISCEKDVSCQWEGDKCE